MRKGYYQKKIEKGMVEELIPEPGVQRDEEILTFIKKILTLALRICNVQKEENWGFRRSGRLSTKGFRDKWTESC
jgi:hypothetical protein